MSLDDGEILKRLKNGDDKSFMEVVESYKKKVMSLCYSYTRDFQEAEDLSQEVFITLYNSIKNFRGDCSLSTYIYRITVSRGLDYKRKRSIKGFLTGLLNLGREDCADLDEKNYVRQCIMALPEELKTPIVLYYYIGLSQKEIAEVLSLSQKAVEGRIYRARQKLKADFEKGGDLECSKNGTI
jgi:RNA polymerase sigma factor (sigma-70 family)